MTYGAKYRFWLLLIAALIAVLIIFVPVIKGQEAAESKNDQDSAEQKKKEKEKKKKPKENPEEIGSRDVSKGINWYSIEKEIALGKSIAQEIERSAKLVDDPVISEYVNRLGQNLVRNSDAKVPFTIKVIDSEEVNAVSLPGGFFFVNSGLIMLVDGEAQLAGVMAHEIAHVAARHGTRQATRGGIINLASIPLIFIGGWGGYGARQAAGLIVPIGFLKFSRAFENEADNLGVQYLYKAGYDPGELSAVFEKLMAQEKKKPGTLNKIFSDHSPHEDRIKKTLIFIESLAPKNEYAVTTSEFDRVKERLQNLHGPRKATEKKDDGRPTLRRNPSSGKIEVEEKNKKDKKDEDEPPPVLKRR